MQTLGFDEYQRLRADARVIERDGHGEKLLALPDGQYVKLFRRKSWFSTALFFPYASRFARNAARLAALSVPTVKVVSVAYCPPVRRHLVTYLPLPGNTLRQELRDGGAACLPLLCQAARFAADLHRLGVYFRSLHFGNIIVSPQGDTFGLIDVADMSFTNRPLTPEKRARNFRHMLRYREDTGYLCAYGGARFLAEYLQASGFGQTDRHSFSTSPLLPDLLRSPQQ